MALPLVDHPSLCPQCRLLVMPCDMDGCGKALRYLDVECMCEKKVATGTRLAPWCSLFGDPGGCRNAVMSWRACRTPEVLHRFSVPGKLFDAWYEDHQWFVVTTSHVKVGHAVAKLPAAPMPHGAGLINGTFEVTTAEGLFRLEGTQWSRLGDGRRRVWRGRHFCAFSGGESDLRSTQGSEREVDFDAPIKDVRFGSRHAVVWHGGSVSIVDLSTRDAPWQVDEVGEAPLVVGGKMWWRKQNRLASQDLTSRREMQTPPITGRISEFSCDEEGCIAVVGESIQKWTPKQGWNELASMPGCEVSKLVLAGGPDARRLLVSVTSSTQSRDLVEVSEGYPRRVVLRNTAEAELHSFFGECGLVCFVAGPKNVEVYQAD